MFDSHCHIGIKSNKGYVCTSKIEEYPFSSNFKYFSCVLLPGEEGDISLLEEWAKKGFGIGEVGLDRRFGEKEKQIKRFILAIKIAKKYDALLTIHAVGMTDLLLSILKEEKPRRFIVHSFSSSTEVAKEIMKLGGVISLSPNVEKTKHFNSLVSSLPYFLTETDLPTGEEEEKVLKEWNKKLSIMLERDIEKESEELFFKIF